jgi:hypothetical protein
MRTIRHDLGAARALWLLAVLSLGAHDVAAQSAAPPSHELVYPYDSGWLRSDPLQATVVVSKTLGIAGAPWMRLRFQSLILGDGATLRITSFSDGAVQEFDAARAREWKLTSAYFNGDALQLDVLAAPGAAASRVVLRSVWIGPLFQPQFSVCGPADDRVPSSDLRIARLLPVGCTGWIFEDAAYCLSTAGHCASTMLQVAQFNTPPSDAAGVMQHPPPEDQYAVDSASIQRENAGVGLDWGYFGCFPNTNTALTPYQRQRAAFAISSPVGQVGQTVRVTGHGLDYDTPTASYTQQTHAGALLSLQGSTLRHDADTTGGNSGSPIFLDNGSLSVVGVHTHGGCTTVGPPGANHGTSSNHGPWALARAQPSGVCAPVASVANYCTPKINSQGCAPSMSATGAPSINATSGSFTLHANSLLNERLGFFLYGSLPKATAFQGGVLCVAPPRRRTGISNTGGSGGGLNCSGSLSFDMGAHIAASTDSTLAFGAIVYVQCWSRDPLDPHGASLSDGLRFTIGP